MRPSIQASKHPICITSPYPNPKTRILSQTSFLTQTARLSFWKPSIQAFNLPFWTLLERTWWYVELCLVRVPHSVPLGLRCVFRTELCRQNMFTLLWWLILILMGYFIVMIVIIACVLLFLFLFPFLFFSDVVWSFWCLTCHAYSSGMHIQTGLCDGLWRRQRCSCCCSSRSTLPYSCIMALFVFFGKIK